MAEVSVISSSIRCGGTPVPRRISVTSDRNEVCSNCRIETLTAIVKSSTPSYFCCHSLSWRQAFSSAHKPIGTTSPEVSAIGMNSLGEM